MDTVPNNRQAILKDWYNAKAALAEAKRVESQLRAQVIEMYSEITDDMHSGTETISDVAGPGWDLKIEHKLAYEIDNANEYADLNVALQRLRAEVEHGDLYAKRIVRKKYELSVTEYKKLPEYARKIIDRVLTIKPAAKSVDLKQNKR